LLSRKGAKTLSGVTLTYTLRIRDTRNTVFKNTGDDNFTIVEYKHFISEFVTLYVKKIKITFVHDNLIYTVIWFKHSNGNKQMSGKFCF
jgi:hypothetical protein